MLSLSSLRRIAHSTSLRASGSAIVFCRSPARERLRWRAAAIASLVAARWWKRWPRWRRAQSEAIGMQDGVRPWRGQGRGERFLERNASRARLGEGYACGRVKRQRRKHRDQDRCERPIGQIICSYYPFLGCCSGLLSASGAHAYRFEKVDEQLRAPTPTIKVHHQP